MASIIFTQIIFCCSGIFFFSFIAINNFVLMIKIEFYSLKICLYAAQKILLLSPRDQVKWAAVVKKRWLTLTRCALSPQLSLSVPGVFLTRRVQHAPSLRSPSPTIAIWMRTPSLPSWGNDRATLGCGVSRVSRFHPHGLPHAYNRPRLGHHFWGALLLQRGELKNYQYIMRNSSLTVLNFNVM